MPVSCAPTLLAALRLGKSSQDSPVWIGDEKTATFLGIVWHPLPDNLGFNVSNIGDSNFTRYSLRNKLASIYDPQGTAVPITVKRKVKLREL